MTLALDPQQVEAISRDHHARRGHERHKLPGRRALGSAGTGQPVAGFSAG
jgi:hypothetical protein